MTDPSEAARYDRGLDVSLVSRVLQSRKKWIVLGVVLGIVLSVVYLLLTPTTYTASARVNITALGTEPVPEGRSVSSLVDIPTERQLAASALTAEGAAEDLGDGWNAGDLNSGLTVSGDPSSTVLTLSYSDTDRQRAVAGADALARSYLVVRTNLVMERVDTMRQNIDERIAELENELRVLMGAGWAMDTAATVRADTVESEILALQQRRATWGDLTSQAGEVISPAASTDLEVTPVAWRIIALGVLGGLFLGLILAAVRHATDRVASHPDDIQEALGVRVLRPHAPTGDPNRWDTAATLAQHHHSSEHPLLVLTDEDVPDAHAAADALADAGPVTRMNLRMERAELLGDLPVSSQAVVIVPPTWRKNTLAELRNDLDVMGISLIGALVAEPTAPAGR